MHMLTPSAFQGLPSSIRPEVKRGNEFLGTGIFLVTGPNYTRCSTDALVLFSDRKLTPPSSVPKDDFKKKRLLGMQNGEDNRTPAQQVFDAGGYKLRHEFLNLVAEHSDGKIPVSAVYHTFSGQLAQKSFGCVRDIFHAVVEAVGQPAMNIKGHHYAAGVPERFKELLKDTLLEDIIVLFDATRNVLREANSYKLKSVAFPVCHIGKMPLKAVLYSMLDGAIRYLHQQRTQLDQSNHSIGKKHGSTLEEIVFFLPKNIQTQRMGQKDVLDMIAGLYDRLMDNA